MIETSGHLPECPCANTSAHPEGCLCCEVSSPCICDRLRACEQRVLEDDVLAAAYHGEKGYEVGYQKGLDAAREAVAALPRLTGVEAALSAIDALREGKK